MSKNKITKNTSNKKEPDWMKAEEDVHKDLEQIINDETISQKYLHRGGRSNNNAPDIFFGKNNKQYSEAICFEVKLLNAYSQIGTIRIQFSKETKQFKNGYNKKSDETTLKIIHKLENYLGELFQEYPTLFLNDNDGTLKDPIDLSEKFDSNLSKEWLEDYSKNKYTTFFALYIKNLDKIFYLKPEDLFKVVNIECWYRVHDRNTHPLTKKRAEIVSLVIGELDKKWEFDQKNKTLNISNSDNTKDIEELINTHLTDENIKRLINEPLTNKNKSFKISIDKDTHLVKVKNENKRYSLIFRIEWNKDVEQLQQVALSHDYIKELLYEKYEEIKDSSN